MSTISGRVSNGVTLGQAGVTSPLTITATGTISNSAGGALYAPLTYPSPTVTNQGTILAETTGFNGIDLKDGGTVGNNGGLIQGSRGIDISGGSGAVTNAGTIIGTGGFGVGDAVFLEAGGRVDNFAGLIQGDRGIYIANAGGTVTNVGTIAAKYDAVRLSAGGSIGNTGLLRGVRGILVTGAAGTVINSGAITGIGDGIDLYAGGVVINTGLISGLFGVDIGRAGGAGANADATVVNAGTFLGAAFSEGGQAVAFGGTGNHRLVLEHGYALGGLTSIYATGKSNTLELLGALGAVTVDFNKSRSGFNSFQTVAFGAPGGYDETLKITNSATLPGKISGFTQPHEAVDLTQMSPAGATAALDASDRLVISSGSQTVALQLDPAGDYSGVVWQTGPDDSGGLLVSVRPAVSLASTLADFGWAEGWGAPDFVRELVADNVQHDTVYVGFGAVGTVMAWGVPGAAPPAFAEFGAQSVPIQDFGTDQGYDATRIRGVAPGFTANSNGLTYQQNIVYGQGDAGIYFYRPVSAAKQPDGVVVPSYETLPELYPDYGADQGWDEHYNFQIAGTTIVGFGEAGIVIAQAAFLPEAAGHQHYVADGTAAIGDAAGWDSLTDVRTILDQNGRNIDLNGDGVLDFVGMGPTGLVYAYGSEVGGGIPEDPRGSSLQFGALQTAHINGAASDLGDAQGWSNATTPRLVADINHDGHPDIVAFGAAGVYVALGQDPATHGGEPFGRLYLGVADFGLDQGWSVAATPRFLADVNGDGILDIVGFGAGMTFTDLGSADAAGKVTWAPNPAATIADFGYQQGWDQTTFRALADVSGSGRADLVLSGAAGTQVWHYN